MRGASEHDIVLEVGAVTRTALEPAMRKGVSGKGSQWERMGGKKNHSWDERKVKMKVKENGRR